MQEELSEQIEEKTNQEVENHGQLVDSPLKHRDLEKQVETLRLSFFRESTADKNIISGNETI